MRTLRSAHILLIFACLLPGCSAPAPAQPPVSPETRPETSPPAEVTATPTPPAEPAPPVDMVTKPVEPVDAQPAGPVDIRGRVTQAHRNAQGLPPVGTLEVEGPVEAGTRYAKATIHVGHETRIFLGRGGKPASFSFIHSGDLVEVTFTGPVTEATGSDPVKATADRIVILEHKP